MSHSAGATTPPRHTLDISISARLLCNGGPRTRCPTACTRFRHGVQSAYLILKGISARLLFSLQDSCRFQRSKTDQRTLKRVPCFSPVPSSNRVEDSLISATEVSQLTGHTASTSSRPKVGEDGGTGTGVVHALAVGPSPAGVCLCVCVVCVGEAVPSNEALSLGELSPNTVSMAHAGTGLSRS